MFSSDRLLLESEPGNMLPIAIDLMIETAHSSDFNSQTVADSIDGWVLFFN